MSGSTPATTKRGTEMQKLKCCPFCGADAEAESWHGGGPEKVMVRCANEDCAVQPGVSGETPTEAAQRWNTRADMGSNASLSGASRKG